MNKTEPGTCQICGCTMENPCYHPEHGYCWWADETETICSHCYSEDIAEDPDTVHCINNFDF